MFSIFTRMLFNYPDPNPPDEPIPDNNVAAKIAFTYCAAIYIFSYYLNEIYSCPIHGLPEQLQSALNFLFTLFLNDINSESIININFFKTVLVFTAVATIIFIFVYWHFEKKRLIKIAEIGILNNNYHYKISYLVALGFVSFILAPYILILKVTPGLGRGSLSPLYNDINHWVPQATRSLGTFILVSFTVFESKAQIIARKNIRQQRG